MKFPPLIILLIAIGLGGYAITIFMSASMLEKVNDGLSFDMPIINHLEQRLVVKELEHEYIFRETIKSCLKSNCKRFIPEVDGESRQRVAFVTPPGLAPLSKTIYSLMESITHQRNRDDPTGATIDLIERSSVPPYGYGKTHGLTAIVRLIPHPLLLEVIGALQGVLKPGESHHAITLQDIKAGLRQILRYHCRLSAVAAHTALLSVSYTALSTSLAAVTTLVQDFLVPDKGPANDGKYQMGSDAKSNTDRVLLFDAQQASGAQILSYIQDSTHADVYTILNQVLLEELKLSKNLTVWPCPSFWSVGDAPNPSMISPLVQRLAKALSPDCADPFADCWVERDKCEDKGDALCQGNTRRV